MVWRILGRVGGLFLVLCCVLAAWLILGIKHHQTYPPPPDALSADDARHLAERLATSDVVSRSDLAVPLAPSTVASAELVIDGQNFFPRIVDDIRSARSSIHIAEYGVRPGQLTD